MGEEEQLSDRELEILRLVATGASNKEIAARLAITANTVKVHLRHVFTKIGVTTRTEATLYAIKAGLTGVETAGNGGNHPVEAGLNLTRPGGTPAIASRRSRFAVLAPILIILVVIIGLGALGFQFLKAGNPPTALPAASESTSSRWQPAVALPAACSSMAVVSYENGIYLIGGNTASGVTGAVLRYNLRSEGWENKAIKPTPASEIQAAVLGEKIYVPGGRDAHGKPSNIFEVYDPRQDRWEKAASLPVALSGYALASLEGRLYLFGGWDGQAARREVYVFDPLSGSWSAGSPLPAARAWSAAIALSDAIYVFGGSDGQHALHTTLAYFPQRQQAGESPWEARADLPAGRYAFGAATLANMIYLAGGSEDDGKTSGLDALQYLPQTDQWVRFELLANEAGNFPALAAIDNHLHLFGGALPEGLLSQHQVIQAIYTILIPVIR